MTETQSGRAVPLVSIGYSQSLSLSTVASRCSFPSRYFAIIEFLGNRFPHTRRIPETLVALLVLSIATFTWALGANAEPTSDSKAMSEVREFEINGTKLYVPINWLIEIYDEARRFIPRYLKPGESIPPEYGSPARLDYLSMTFCSPQEVPRPERQVGAPREFELRRLFNASEIPPDWCIGRVTLVRGEMNVSDKPRLGASAIPQDFREKYLGQIDRWDFRVRSQEPKEGFGDYFGFRDSDVSRSGGPIAISCGSSFPGTGFFRCSVGDIFQGSAPAVSGIHTHAFDWHMDKIRPEKLRLIYWRSQGILDWLISRPDYRSSQIQDSQNGYRK